MKKQVRRTFFSLLLVLILFSTTLTGCSTKEATIKIGGIAPVTGDAATFGISTRNGYEMAIE